MLKLLILSILFTMVACCTSKSSHYAQSQQYNHKIVSVPQDTYLVKNMCYTNVDTVKADYYVVVNESDLGIVYFRVDNPNTGMYKTVATYTYSSNCLLTITLLVK